MAWYPVVSSDAFVEKRRQEYSNITAKNISVVIPFLNNWELTNQRLMDLWRHVYLKEIILIDDGSTDPSIDTKVAWWQKETDLPITYIKNRENLGFGKSMNKGIWTAQGDVVVLLSNDVVISGDFSLQILEHIEPDVLMGNTLYDFPTGWNVFPMPDGSRLFPYLGGDFLAAYKDSFIELGGFDDLYGLFDYEDVDLSTRAVFMGYQLVPLNSPYLKHLSGQTVRKYHPDREKYTRENQAKFHQKWKKILYEDSSKFTDNI